MQRAMPFISGHLFLCLDVHPVQLNYRKCRCRFCRQWALGSLASLRFIVNSILVFFLLHSPLVTAPWSFIRNSFSVLTCHSFVISIIFYPAPIPFSQPRQLITPHCRPPPYHSTPGTNSFSTSTKHHTPSLLTPK